MSKYRDAGVDIDAGSRAVKMMRSAVQSTYGARVLGGIGSFGGLFDMTGFPMKQPVLVASTDGVGTKTKVASVFNRFDTVGQDIVNHCVNDILVLGAQPLFFLDYIASSKLEPKMVARVVEGVALACRVAECALIGGETAEMPGVYVDGEFDLAGTIVGAVDRDSRNSIIDGGSIVPGDLVVGLASSGLHTNGYSLARSVFSDLHADIPELGTTLENALLEPHRSYLHVFRSLCSAGIPIHGMAHITGGGLVENPPRILPDGVAMHIASGSWSVPPLFRILQEMGQISDAEMRRVFNCGLGMLVVLPARAAQAAVAISCASGCQAWIVGEIFYRDCGPVMCFDI